MPGPSQNFSGLDMATWGIGWPPDTNGDVGPNHYIQAVNTSIGVYYKNGTIAAGPFTLNTFFNPLGISNPCGNNQNRGDPIVLYDQTFNRWIITDFAFAGTGLPVAPFYECIAVSKSGDPVSGGWWMYAFLAHSTLLNDYPKLGVWSDAYYMSANLFDLSDVLQGVRVWALDRAAMLNGQPFTSVSFDLPCLPFPCYYTLLPSNFRGSIPPPGTPNYFISNDLDFFQLDVWKFHVDFATPANSTLTGPIAVSEAAYSPPPATVPEQGGNNLDTLFDQLMMQNQYRNISGTESLWTTHTVSSSGVTGVRWYQLDVTGGTIVSAPIQQSTFQPDSNYRWMPSLAVDRAGNMAIGYSVSSPSMYPAIRYAGRLVTDTLSTLGQGEATLISGTGAQNNTCGGSTCTRWGDYSAMTVDPVDDCTFWYTNEYYVTTGGNWQTRIGSFKFPSCTPTYFIYLPLIMK